MDVRDVILNSNSGINFVFSLVNISADSPGFIFSFPGFLRLRLLKIILESMSDKVHEILDMVGILPIFAAEEKK